MWKILLKSEVSIKQIYIISLYILCCAVSLLRELTGGGCGKDLLILLAPGFWILVIPPGGTESARIWLSKFSWYTLSSQKNMLTKKSDLGGHGPKIMWRKYVVFFLQSLFSLPKIISIMNANYAEKNFLPLYFFSTAKHFIIKRNNFSNYPFLSANKKELIARLQSCYIWEIVSFKNL